MRLWEMLLSIILPKFCLSCGKFGSYFCPVCVEKLRPRTTHVCPVCIQPAIGGETHIQCKTKYTPDGFLGLFSYEDAIKKAITNIKYRKMRSIAPELIAVYKDILIQKDFQIHNELLSYIHTNNPIIVPIPLHWQRLRTRTFNQSALLAEQFAKAMNLTHEPTILMRNIYKPPQVTLHKTERLNNVRGVFSIQPKREKYVHSQNFLLVDDVWTTGATMREAVRILKTAGARKVWCMTIAR